ncbi:MAG: MlaC/ttg2D family ABC transporter substrate-binding protein [Geminicoccaceae bacterium]
MVFADGGLRRRAVMFLGALVFCAGAQNAQAEPDVTAARAMIEEVGQEFLAVLGPDGQEDEAQLQKLTGLLKEAINLDITGRLILAKNWRSASDEQRTAYLDLFRPYALDNLASKIRSSSAEIPLQNFEIIKGEVVGKSDVLVSTDLFWRGFPPYRLDWRLRGRDDGSLQAIDVVVEGVSMVVTQRAEFASVIERRGFDGLLARMRDQVKRQL